MSSRAHLEELRKVIRDAGLRATPSRVTVLELLNGSEQPVSHGEVANRLASHAWDPATLYRNLSDFVTVGLVRRTDVGDHVWRFELVRGGHDRAAHPHFVCTECGTIECLPKLELVLPRTSAPKAVRQRKIEVQLRGLCDACG
ncbi:MAG: Fur family transcriptional regulator [Kofleriaceae bacterium]